MTRTIDGSKLSAGDKATSGMSGNTLTVIGRSIDNEHLVVEGIDGVLKIPLNYYLLEVPLFKLSDGTEVHKGDTLYFNLNFGGYSEFVTVSFADGRAYDKYGDWMLINALFATPPKKLVTRWINVYESNTYETKEAADTNASRNRIKCVEVQIEI
jgi:hypothetical protein